MARPHWWWKPLAGTAVALAVLAGVELVLRASWGVPPPSDMVLRIGKCRLERVGADVAMQCTPPDAQDPRVPAVPEMGRPRVVFLGGSSLKYPMRRDVPTALARSSPDLEVVNLAHSGMAAAGVASIAAQLDALQPALVVIYTGHNDYNATVFQGRVQAARLWMLPLYRFTSGSWIHYFLRRTPKVLGPSQDPGRRADRLLATDDPTALELQEQLDERFAADLRTAVRVSPAPVMLATLLRDSSRPPTGLLVQGWPDCAAVAHQLTAGRRQTELRASLELAEQRCGDGAVTWWLRSRLAEEQGDRAGAAAAFAESLRLDPLPLRAPPSADEVIRQVAVSEDARLVDLQQLSGGLPPRAWFTDPVHFSEQGVAQVVQWLEPEIRDALGAQ